MNHQALAPTRLIIYEAIAEMIVPIEAISWHNTFSIINWRYKKTGNCWIIKVFSSANFTLE